MDLIYSNSDKEDIGVLKDYKYDLAFGSDENNFEVTVSSSNHVCDAGFFVYIENTEYGGIIDSVHVDSAKETVKYKGRTWHGLLESQILQPDINQDYLVVSGEANAIINSLLIKTKLDGLFKASTDDSKINITNYKMNRYIGEYSGIRKMLSTKNAKLKFIFKDGFVELSAKPLINYAEDDEFDTDQIKFKIQKNYKPINHVICLGKGDLKDRRVIHVFADLLGNISGNQTLFGLDEVCHVYDYPNTESDDELLEGGIEIIQKAYASDSVDFKFETNNESFDVGDVIGAKELITGTYVVAAITKKIISFENYNTKISYKCESGTGTIASSGYPSSGSGGGSGIVIDDALSTTSENPVQNKVVTNAIDKAGLLPTTQIPTNANLNTFAYCNVGRYYCPLNTTVATLTNCPTTNAFVMEVYSPLSTRTDISPTGDVYRVRKILDYKGFEYTQYITIHNNTPTYHEWHTTNRVDVYLNRPTDANMATMGDGKLIHYKATSSMASNKPNSDGHIIQLNWDNKNGYDSQLFIPNNTVYRHPMQYRAQNAGAWDKWHDILAVDTTANPISSTSDDTTAKWKEIGSGIYFYNATGCLIDQPSQYALLIHLKLGYEIRQLWLTQSTGSIWHRGGNTDGWNGGWRKLWDNANIDTALSTTSGSPVQNKVITTALNGKQATLTFTSGTATWNTTYAGSSSSRSVNWRKYGRIVIASIYDAIMTTSCKNDQSTSIIASGLPKASSSSTAMLIGNSVSKRIGIAAGSTNLTFWWAGTVTSNTAGMNGQIMYIAD